MLLLALLPGSLRLSRRHAADLRPQLTAGLREDPRHGRLLALHVGDTVEWLFQEARRHRVRGSVGEQVVQRR